MMRDDLFICVHEQFLTDTARMADIVYLQRLSWNTMISTCQRPYFLQVAKAIIEPWGDCKSNHEVICQLARRLGHPIPALP